MRHLKKSKKFGRKTAHRKALFKNLSIALINEENITTTLTKAKELRSYIEPLINKTKEDNFVNRRYIFNKLHNKPAVTKLFNDIAGRNKDRHGGYLRILKSGYRKGDNAPMAYVQIL